MLLALFALGAVVQGADVSPVEKVITMLQDLQTQVITEGKLESKTYNTFACFCKDMSEEKNKAITDGQDSKGTIEGNLATLTSARDDLDTVIADLSTRIASVTKAMADAKAEREKDSAEYVVEEAEIHHAADSVKGALDMLEAQKKAFNKAGLIQEQEEQKKKAFAGFVRDIAQIADKSDSLSSKKKKVLAMLLMSDDPMALLQADMAGTTPEDTEFASGEII